MALGYDAQGNVAFKNGSRYRFDMGNRLRGTAGETYRYDAEGRRVRSESAGGQVRESDYAKDGRLMWQRDEVAGQRRVNVYLSGSLVADYSRPLAANTVTVSYIHTDALGSPIAKTDVSGAVIETSEYEPYGKLLNRPNDDRAGYTGHVMDSASGLTYMQQRYYDPSVGRFLSTDPVTAYEKPMTNFNRYVYALNNPYRFTDPDGRDSVGEMIDSGAEGCGAVSCAGWAAGKALWSVFGAEGVSQVSDKGWGGSTTGDKVMAGIEVGTLGLGGKVGAGVKALMGFAKEVSPVARLSGQLAKEFGVGGALAKNGAGNVFKLADGKVTVRVMESGGGRTNYLRVSVEGKGSVDAAGKLSSDPAKTHIPIGKESLDLIRDVVKKYSQ